MPTVECMLSYLAEMAERPFFYLYDPPSGTPSRNTRGDRRRVTIHDGRELVPGPSLDREGFMLASHETAVEDLLDPAAIRARYYPEVETLVQRITGATRVVAFDHNVRSTPMAERGERGAQRPVRFPHNDYTERSGPQRVRDLFPPEEAERLLGNRVAVINVEADSRLRGGVATRRLRCAHDRDAGPRPERPPLPGSQRRDLFAPLQSRPSLVLLLPHAPERGDAPQVLRLRPGPGPVHRAHRFRRSDEPARCPGARVDRGAHARLLLTAHAAR